ncbi:hypothetical protein [Rhodoferax antarcticus]|uniref:PLD phosphodiesterase domain-containing protein n=1 Tax=Rhodoferax antarcticus ANT.BR TaxID=1111071 RepID=A0A1Q8YIK7_9BURK|nr:hypothetical protein [Rhodoferax antarcticus]APW47981.1 hypothetical protein RA876_18345 [Rhodoferax antarcticus]OLP07793.1 hypothetical protein BLL52_0889 [Rhodoferax antarcticus ANT.BR]
MKSLTISESFKEAIGARTVKSAFFSTYCFEPDFFELDVVPLLLGGPALSTDETIRYHQLQSLMSFGRGRFAVAYDVDVFNPTFAAKLEIDYLPVRVPAACQHAKIAVLEVLDEQDNVAIILAAGSFNLTKAGWWTNIEVGHWIELSKENAPLNVLIPLRAALDYFQTTQPVPAIEALQARLSEWKTGPRSEVCSFYFSGAGKVRNSFPDFLNAVDRGPVEIVSPFFAEEGDNTEMVKFLISFKKVSLFLPTDDTGAATMTHPVYQDLSKLVQWCDWNADLAQRFSLRKNEELERKLHAKIYSGKNWLFIGSVNLSYMAMYRNVEAGFLLTGRSELKLLTPLKEEAQKFSAKDPVEAAKHNSEVAMPPIQLTYDWLTHELEMLSPETGRLTLYDAQGQKIGQYPLTAQATSKFTVASLSAQLKHSALVAATWNSPDGASSDKRNLLVSQRQIYCRPNSLPELDVQDLLRIFQNMNSAVRMAMITSLVEKQARRSKEGLTSNEFLSPLPSTEDRSNFFSEFSEVNGAFWNLRKKLGQAQSAGRTNELAYYLDGQQPDSLRGLANSLGATDDGSQISLIVRYLTLLSMDEILTLYPPKSNNLKREVLELIGQTEQNEEFDALPNKFEFLAWIKDKFTMPVIQVATSPTQQVSSDEQA